MGACGSRTVFVETVEHGDGTMDMHEWASAADALRRLGYSVVRFTAEEMARTGGTKQLGVTADTPVIGGRASMRTALRTCNAIGVDAPLPERPDYPAVLKPFLGRTIEPGTLQDALDASDFARPTFVKPRGANNVKLFNGVVLDCNSHAFLDKVPRDSPVWMSEKLDGLVAEWRCYVLHGHVDAVVCYAGDEAAPLNMRRVQQAAQRLYASDEGSAAFALDFGVVKASGRDAARTVLIEVNDGFSLGLYPGCAHETYAEMMVARWDEIVVRGS